MTMSACVVVGVRDNKKRDKREYKIQYARESLSERTSEREN